jgi:tripartite-type tricarboxylate transporter receptor subunit TctC
MGVQAALKGRDSGGRPEARVIPRRAVLLIAAVIAALPVVASAQEFPVKQIRIVVPYPPGGPTDALARIVGQEIAATLGQTVIVENRAGASGAIGTREVAKAEPDGHTLVLGNNQTHATNALLLKDAGYDPIADFVPIAGLADLQHVLVVRKDLGVASVPQLVALARKEPAKLNYGSTGLGSGSHLAMELFKTRTGLQMQHVPFKGAAPLALEIVAGRIDLAFATLPSVLGQIEAGEMKAVAIASLGRAPQLPDVPRLSEQGVTNSEADSWLALFAPARTPAPALDKLTRAVLAALAKPDVAGKAVKQGIAINVRPPQAFRGYHADEMRKWSEVIQAAGLKGGG